MKHIIVCFFIVGVYFLLGLFTSSAFAANYTVSQNVVYKDGTRITLKGVNWFGAELGEHVVQGLWARNYKDMIAHMKSLGFNAVRVLFCPATIHESEVMNIDYAKNPDLSQLNSKQVLDKVLEELDRQAMFIVLDHHTVDCQTFTPYWYTDSYSQERWIRDLQLVATRYKHLEYFAGIDLKNEPYGASWGSGNVGTDWNLAAERAGKEVLSVNPNILIFVTGIASDAYCSSQRGHWWGGNFEPFACKSIDASKIPTNKLVIAVTVYGIDLWPQTYFSEPNFQNNLRDIWEKDFGYLADKGYTIVIKEWGSKLGANAGNPKDVTIFNAMADYFKAKKICNTFWWSLNPDPSSPVNGILQND